MRNNSNKEQRTKTQVPRTKNQVPRTKNQVPRTKFQEPRTKNQEPSSKFQVPSPKSQDPSPKNKKQRTIQLTNIQKILSQGEGLIVEFKLAKNELPSSLFETVCAFLNRYGGDIIIGINDRGEVEGVDSKQTKQLY